MMTDIYLNITLKMTYNFDFPFDMFTHCRMSRLQSWMKMIQSFKEHIDPGKYPVTRTSQGRGNVFGL